MKYYLIIPFFSFLVTSCSNLRPLPIKIIGKENAIKQEVNEVSLPVDRIKCVSEFIRQEVEPMNANIICSDIFKRR